MQGLPDADAIREASISVSTIYLLTHCTTRTPWVDFEHGMRQKFGANEQTIIVHYKSLHAYNVENSVKMRVHSPSVDDMNMMFAQSAFPDVMGTSLLKHSLKPSLRKQVQRTNAFVAHVFCTN